MHRLPRRWLRFGIQRSLCRGPHSTLRFLRKWRISSLGSRPSRLYYDSEFTCKSKEVPNTEYAPGQSTHQVPGAWSLKGSVAGGCCLFEDLNAWYGEAVVQLCSSRFMLGYFSTMYVCTYSQAAPEFLQNVGCNTSDPRQGSVTSTTCRRVRGTEECVMSNDVQGTKYIFVVSTDVLAAATLSPRSPHGLLIEGSRGIKGLC